MTTGLVPPPSLPDDDDDDDAVVYPQIYKEVRLCVVCVKMFVYFERSRTNTETRPVECCSRTPRALRVCDARNKKHMSQFTSDSVARWRAWQITLLPTDDICRSLALPPPTLVLYGTASIILTGNGGK